MLLARLSPLISKTFLLLLLPACGAPMAGNWHGTFDKGPVDAHPVVLHVQEDGHTGYLDIHEPGKAFTRFNLCSLDVDPERRVTLVYDANRPNCDAGTQNQGGPENKDPPERRTLKGMVGETVYYGDVLKDAEKLGFFRLFRDPDHDNTQK